MKDSILDSERAVASTLVPILGKARAQQLLADKHNHRAWREKNILRMKNPKEFGKSKLVLKMKIEGL